MERAMPLTWERDDARQLFTGRGTGVLAAEDLLPAVPTRSGEYRMYRMLFDVRGATTSVMGADIRRVVANVMSASSKEGPRGPVAIVADDPAFFGMARMYETICEHAGLDKRPGLQFAGPGHTLART
jgi:hypothetical protein